MVRKATVVVTGEKKLPTIILVIMVMVLVAVLLPFFTDTSTSPQTLQGTQIEHVMREQDAIHKSRDRNENPGFNNINLYLGENLDLNTTPPGDKNPSVTTLSDGESVEFTSTTPLYRDLQVKGIVDEEKNGFKLFLAALYLGSTECYLTVKVLNGELEVASSTFTREELRTELKLIMFNEEVAPDNLYTFEKGRSIRLKINVSIKEGQGSGSVAISYDADTTNSRLALYAHHILNVDAYTSRDGIIMNMFYPNLGTGERYLDIEGNITDCLGDNDIFRVDIDIFDPTDELLYNGSAVLEPGEIDEFMFFSMHWDYQEGLPAGSYRINVMVLDNSLNSFNYSVDINMAEHGLMMESPIFSKTVAPGENVEFDILVKNIGGKNDVVDLNTVATPSWTLELTPSVNLTAGDEQSLVLTLHVPAGTSGGTICNIVITGTSRGNNDVSCSPSKPLEAKVSSLHMFSAMLESESQQVVSSGESASFLFTITNTGEKDDAVVVEVPSGPVGWRIEVTSGAAILSSNNGEKKLYLIPLKSLESKNFSLTVSPPDESVVEYRASITIIFKSQNNSEMSRSIRITTDLLYTGEGLTLSTEEDMQMSGWRKSERAFQKVSFTISATNMDIVEHLAYIQVEPKMEDWEIEYPEDILLGPDTPTSFIVSITPPPVALCTEGQGIEFLVKVHYTSNNSENFEESLSLYINVEQYFDFTMNLKGENSRVSSSSVTPVKFHLEIKNNGNGVDKIELGDGDASDWSVEFSHNSLLLSADESTNVIITVTPPDTAGNGDFRDITIYALNKEGKKMESTISVEMKIQLSERFKNLFEDLNFWIIFILFIFLFALIVVIQYHLKKEK